MRIHPGGLLVTGVGLSVAGNACLVHLFRTGSTFIMPFLWANNKELYLVKAGFTVPTGSTWTGSGVLLLYDAH